MPCDIIGQEKLLNELRYVIEKKKFPRFCILTGAKGSGRKVIAYWIADRMQLPLIRIGTKVDEIREMIKNAYVITQPVLYFIPDADDMSNAAKAALLKVLEEPPNSAYIIMTLEAESATLPTILSRAARFYLEKYTTIDIRRYFYEYHHPNHGEEEEQIIVDLCETPGEVDYLVDIGIAKFDAYVQSVFDNIAEVSGANAFKIADRIDLKGKGGYDFKLFLKAFSNKCTTALWDHLPTNIDELDIELYRRYVSAIQICQKYLAELKIPGINKSAVFDMWLLAIRASWIVGD